MNQSDDAYLRKLLETYRALLDPGIYLFEAEDVTVDSSGSLCTSVKRVRVEYPGEG